MNDVLPEAIGAWQHFESCTRELLTAYGYQEIRVPLLEHTELFQRAIGEHTDVVGKEMYTFIDRGGDSLTLRPEATAGINSLGTAESRRVYRARLVEYLEAHEAQLDADSRRRLLGNPLRVLDSKNPEMQALIRGAPLLTEHLDPESQAHFAELCATLRAVGVPYEINPRLVRGLDYYNRTVFEWVTASSGAQNAVCSGGRYDGLIAQLGGDATPAIGFAMGVERLVMLLVAAGRTPAAAHPDVYVVVGGSQAVSPALQLVERLRTERPAVRFELNVGGGNLKAQFRRADRSGAVLAVIVGEDEIARAVVGLKPLRDTAGQSECPIAQLPAGLDAALAAAQGAAAAP
jgi:histidyl-tRNA synthetase